MKRTAALLVFILFLSSLFSVLPPRAQAAASLTNGYVTPVTGDITTQFYYYVTFYDSSGLAPEIGCVVIDGSSTQIMNLWNGVPSNGVYRYSTTLAVGTHTYYFWFNLGGGGSTVYLGFPSNPYSGPTVNPIQRRLTVSGGDHDSPNPPNGNWYFNDGQTVWCSVTSPVTEGGIVWTCTGWTGTGSVPPSGGGSVVSFVIAQDSSITWYWYGTPIPTHTLTVYSAHDSPIPGNGPHTYNDGQSVTCSVTSPVTEGSTEWNCTGWSGTGSVPPSGSSTSVTFPIYQDSSITWNWEEVVPPNNPPSTPTSPEWISGEHILVGTPTSSEGFCSQATDPDGDDVMITFDWGDGNNDTTGWLPSGSPEDKYHSWAYPGMFEIKTKATDIHSAESSWSSPLEITVVTGTPLRNWAGYMVESPTEPITSVEGGWTVPEFGTALHGFQGIWVGVGGNGPARPLLQAGIMTVTMPELGYAWMRAFWERVPGFLYVDLTLGHDVFSGDTIWAKVSESPTIPGKWNIEVKDLSQDWTWSQDGIDGPDQTTAEWIFEPGAGPFGGTNVASSFTPIVFADAKLEIGSVVYDIGRVGQGINSNLYQLNFERDGVVCTNVSLISGYSDFEILDTGSRSAIPVPVTSISLFSSAELHVYDPVGNHLGYNSTSGLIDLKIPDSMYLQDEGVQYALLFNPDEYQIDLVGKETGDFHLHTQIVTNETVTLDRWVNETIVIDEIKTYYLIHQISLQDLENSKTVIGQGYNCSISIVVFNNGNYTETFNVTAYANTTIIGTQPVTLTRGNSTTVTFTWNTTDVPYGNYTISAYAALVPGETDTSDNILVDGTVTVIAPTPVGGISVPVNKLALLAPYIGLTILLAAAVTTVVYVKRRKRNTEIIS